MSGRSVPALVPQWLRTPISVFLAGFCLLVWGAVVLLVLSERYPVNEAALSRIKPGMDRADVEKVLGRPSHVSQAHGILTYSVALSRVHVVIKLGPTGKVDGVELDWD